MGFFARLLRSAAQLPRPEQPQSIPENVASGDRSVRHYGSVEAVGESNYQPALRRLRGDGEDGDACQVVIEAEPSNAYDANAVRVCDSDGETLGYLRRDLAREFQPFLLSSGPQLVHARLFGGDSDRPSIGIWLDLQIVAEAQRSWARKA